MKKDPKSDLIASVLDRLALAGWVSGYMETPDKFSIEWTPKGRDSIGLLFNLIQDIERDSRLSLGEFKALLVIARVEGPEQN